MPDGRLRGEEEGWRRARKRKGVRKIEVTEYLMCEREHRPRLEDFRTRNTDMVNVSTSFDAECQIDKEISALMGKKAES